MAVLARASRDELENALREVGDIPPHTFAKPPETGTVMVEGRAGGAGQRFNVGEATVTRCVVRCRGRLGFSYALGRDKEHARLAAILDALLLDPDQGDALNATVIEPLAQRQESRRESQLRKAAATKVDFFTLVRGEG